MIALTLVATFHVTGDGPIDHAVAVSGPASITTTREREGDRVETVLVDDITALLAYDWAPRNHGDSLKLELRGVWHVVLGMRLHRAHRRHLRRAAERLWPVDQAAPPPVAKAAFHLLLHGTAALRMAEWGLSVTRT